MSDPLSDFTQPDADMDPDKTPAETDETDGAEHDALGSVLGGDPDDDAETQTSPAGEDDDADVHGDPDQVT